MDDRIFNSIPENEKNDYLGKLGGCGNCRHWIKKCSLPESRKRYWNQVYDNGCGALQSSMINTDYLKNIKL